MVGWRRRRRRQSQNVDRKKKSMRFKSKSLNGGNWARDV